MLIITAPQLRLLDRFAGGALPRSALRGGELIVLRELARKKLVRTTKSEAGLAHEITDAGRAVRAALRLVAG